MSYLHIDLAWAAGQVALGAARQALGHVPARPFTLQPRHLEPLLRLIPHIALVVHGLLAALLAAQRLAGILLRLLFLRIPAQHEAVHARVLLGRVDGDPTTWRQLVELLDLVLVAEAVAPPAGQVVDAVALHPLEQLPPAVRRAHQLLLLLGFGFLGGGRAVLRHLVGYDGDAAEEALALQHDGLVCVFERILAGRCVGGLIALRQLLCRLRAGYRRARAG
jgi:hypothetical protein